MLTTTGPRATVELLHSRASQFLLDWILGSIKKAVAKAKRQCTASDAELRKTLRRTMGPMGFIVTREIDLLGTDYSAGGTHQIRKQMATRIHKAWRRRYKLKWWGRMGGNVQQVMDRGLIPSAAYNIETTGFPPGRMRRVRRLQGIMTRVKCKGSSLTAKLALAGPEAADADIATRHPAPPLKALLSLLWDCPRYRFPFIAAWRQACREVKGEGVKPHWQMVRGVVGAAMAHTQQLGIQWVAPFKICLRNQLVDILTTPPKQIYAVVQEQARVNADLALLERLAHRRGWDAAAIARQYQHGIDWEIIRKLLKGPELNAVQKHALTVSTAGGFWSDERRWRCNLAETPICATCGEDIGSDLHDFTAQCGAVHSHLLAERIASRARKIPRAVHEPGLAPLVCLCLPPRATAWEPVPESQVEGYMTREWDENTYGDGSGYRQDVGDLRVSTWSNVRLGKDGYQERARCLVPGYFSTSFRGELTALVYHLKHYGIQGAFVSDCQSVVDGAWHGVANYYTSSKCLHADLWKEVKAALHDIGGQINITKVKAHRSWRQAVDAGEDEKIWEGNRLADEHCKQLARDWAAADTRYKELVDSRRTTMEIIEHTIAVMTWAFNARPQWAKGQKRHGGRKAGRATPIDGGHQLVKVGKLRWRCVSCRREAWDGRGRQRLLASRCGGEVAARCHQSHDVDILKGIVWCRKCAAFATRQLRLLKTECPNQPTSANARNIRNRLMKGLAPSEADYFTLVDEAWREVPRPNANNIIVGRTDNDRKHGDEHECVDALDHVHEVRVDDLELAGVDGHGHGEPRVSITSDVVGARQQGRDEQYIDERCAAMEAGRRSR